jgi:plasmid maintenance system killer protein
MEVLIADEDLQELIETGKNKAYKKISRDKTLMSGLAKAVSIMRTVSNVSDLKAFSYLHYEHLKYELSDVSSVRVVSNRVERLLFTEREDGVEITLLKLDETHYGNKK